MRDLKPKLFSVMKNYNKDQFVKDLISGIIVAIIAPLIFKNGIKLKFKTNFTIAPTVAAIAVSFAFFIP